MVSVLYMPDGNRGYAKKKDISLFEAYYQGGKTLKLLSQFFVVEGRADTLIYHAMSKRTHKRTDSSLDAIYEAATKTFEDLLTEGFFVKNAISFEMIDHSGSLPEKLEEAGKELSRLTERLDGGKVLALLGYFLEDDMNHALSQIPERSDYNTLRQALLFPDIDLVIRPTVMELAEGPVYAMSKAMMITLSKLNPGVTKEDLSNLWEDFCKFREDRKKDYPFLK